MFFFSRLFVTSIHFPVSTTPRPLQWRLCLLIHGLASPPHSVPPILIPSSTLLNDGGWLRVRAAEREQQNWQAAARDSSHVKGKMEQHTGTEDFNILLATDSYKVSRDPKPNLARCITHRWTRDWEENEGKRKGNEGGFILQAVNGWVSVSQVCRPNVCEERRQVHPHLYFSKENISVYVSNSFI